MKPVIIFLIQSSCLLVYSFIASIPAWAQVTADGTTSTTVTSPDGNNFTINDGDRAGGNLFHSFQDFSVPTNGSAFFDNAVDIDNIINRVTGGNISSIDGLLRANGNANLFLINPAGIIFGQNARLDIGGSFLGSTADRLLFPEGEFSATDLDNPPLLTINAPIGLNFRDSPAPITNRSFVQNITVTDFVGLEVPPGTNLTLVGGDINFEAGEATARGGRVDLGGLSEAGTVTINENGSLSFPEGIARADVTFTNAADVDVRAAGGGSITVNGRNIELSGGEFGASTLRAGIVTDSGSTTAQAGDITLNATDTITVSQGSNIDNEVASTGVGSSGGIKITTTDLSLTQGGQVSASTFGQGNAEAITINASGTISADGENQDGNPSGVFSRVFSEAVGDGRDITITAGTLELTNGAQIAAFTRGRGNAGAVTITANDTVSFDGEGQDGSNSGAGSIVESEAEGDGGGITITTGTLAVTNGAQIGGTTFGQGNAGTVTIIATDSISFDGEGQDGNSSGAFSDVGSEAKGDAGSVTITTGTLAVTNGANISASTFGEGDARGITITTGSLEVTNGVQIATSTFGQGNSGAITINATDSVSFAGEGQDGNINNISGVFSTVEPGSEGDAGSVTITTGSLDVINGAQINASTFGQGNAGAITINATDAVSFDGETPDGLAVSGAFSGVSSEAEGDGGGVTITTGTLDVTNGAQILSNTRGRGNAGAVTINATDVVSFDGETPDGSESGAFSIVESKAEGDAGGVTITTGTLDVTNGAQIDASTLSRGNAGTVTITANDTVSFDGEGQDVSGAASQVGSEAVGNAGGVIITTDSLAVTNGAQISASTRGQGSAGTITIDATDRVSFDGEGQDGRPSGAFSTVRPGAEGNAGGVSITTGSLDVTNEAELSTSTFGRGNAGTVTINATDLVSFDNSSALSGVGSDALGNAGGVTITTGTLDVTNGAQISASTFGQGNGGSVFVEADTLTLDNGSIVATNQPSQPIADLENDLESGNITLEIADNLILRNNSLISARAGSNANGGNVNIDAEFIIAFPNGNNDIIANAQQGQGGNINITAESLFGIEERLQNPFTNDIDASSEFGLDGSVSINTPDIGTLQETIEAPEVVESEALGANACSRGEATETSSFTITGKGGVPPEPTEPFAADAIVIEGKSSSIGTEQAEGIKQEEIKPIITDQGEIYPARGIILKENGDVILTAYPTNNVQRTPHSSSNCRKS